MYDVFHGALERMQNELMFFTSDKFGAQTFPVWLSRSLSMWKDPFEDAVFNIIYNRFGSCPRFFERI